jgi:hypothetical protein
MSTFRISSPYQVVVYFSIGSIRTGANGQLCLDQATQNLTT